MTETAAVYNVGITRPQSKPSFDSQLQTLPPDVRYVAESLALRDMESARRSVAQYLASRRLTTNRCQTPTQIAAICGERR